MKKLSPNKNIVHFIGIGGIGTSALARWFLTHNYKISGSDSEASLITDALKKEGARIFIGHQAKNVPQKAGLVVYNAAILTENPELKRAKFLKIPTKSYAEALGDLTRQYKSFAVSGSHGKSTTTALLSLVLTKAKFDPTVIIGTKLKEFRDSNFRKGGSRYLILEADEYNGSFLNYSPFAAIITNIDREHLDYYKNLTKIKNAFLKFIGNIQPGGILVVNKDDKNLFSLKNKIEKISKKNNLMVFWRGTRVNPAVNRYLSASLKIPGNHNISNALAVYTLSKALKIKDEDIFKAIADYHGSWRRMEYRGQLKVKSHKLKADVYDDYAHHPTEIKATLSGLRQKYPKSKIICVFQPHQAKRLELLFNEFSGAFDKADILILLNMFKVKGRDKTSQNINSKKLAAAIIKRKSSPLVLYLKHSKNLKNIIKKKLLNAKSPVLSPKPRLPNPIIIMMGAGDIYKLTDSLIK